MELKKAIINALKEDRLSLRKLETKLNTNNKTILIHIKELEFLGVVNVTKTKEDSKNGRPYTLVELTNYGKNLK